ncbi:hypothetical protein [Afipia carboxidovorans]|uniref:hypothetical protein n=1 Tax=Afipia carboxidovorans TaxID=40137 RepID=UPI00308E253B|nr:hypothetical protein CRBSH125_09540 [Afipia carboxidovorans]
MSDLKTQAEELGIKVDGRWSDERIQQEIAAVKPAAATSEPRARVQPFKINRDYWDEQGARHRKGEIVELTADDALDGLESGALSRVKG